MLPAVNVSKDTPGHLFGSLAAYDKHFPPLGKVRHTYIHTYIHTHIHTYIHTYNNEMDSCI